MRLGHAGGHIDAVEIEERVLFLDHAREPAEVCAERELRFFFLSPGHRDAITGRSLVDLRKPDEIEPRNGRRSVAWYGHGKKCVELGNQGAFGEFLGIAPQEGAIVPTIDHQPIEEVLILGNESRAIAIGA